MADKAENQMILVTDQFFSLFFISARLSIKRNLTKRRCRNEQGDNLFFDALAVAYVSRHVLSYVQKKRLEMF